MARQIQTPIKGKPRKRRTSYMHPTLRRALRDAAHEANASQSLIIAVAVAKFLGVRDQEWLR